MAHMIQQSGMEQNELKVFQTLSFGPIPTWKEVLMPVLVQPLQSNTSLSSNPHGSKMVEQASSGSMMQYFLSFLLKKKTYLNDQITLLTHLNQSFSCCFYQTASVRNLNSLLQSEKSFPKLMSSIPHVLKSQSSGALTRTPLTKSGRFLPSGYVIVKIINNQQQQSKQSCQNTLNDLSEIISRSTDKDYFQITKNLYYGIINALLFVIIVQLYNEHNFQGTFRIPFAINRKCHPPVKSQWSFSEKSQPWSQTLQFSYAQVEKEIVLQKMEAKNTFRPLRLEQMISQNPHLNKSNILLVLSIKSQLMSNLLCLNQVLSVDFGRLLYIDKVKMRTTKVITLTLICLAMIASMFYFSFKPYYLSSVQFHGKSISIERDQYGVATLHVSEIQEYLYALGNVLAEDRLFQIAFRTILVQGRVSELVGEKSLEFDRYFREINLKYWADRRSQKFKVQNYTYYEKVKAMAEGINDRVAKMPFLPLQFHLIGMKWQNFTVNHILYLQILIQWTISMNIQEEYIRSILLSNYTFDQIQLLLPNKQQTWAFPSIPIISDDQIPDRLRTSHINAHLQSIKLNPVKIHSFIQLDIFEYLGNIQGSNSFAISGQHTQSGKPLIANDPHLESIIPSQWYPYKISYTKTDGRVFRSTGITSSGIPHFFGKNEYFSGAMSVSHGDNQDLFEQRIQGDKYLVNGVWRDLKKRVEIIKIKTDKGLVQQRYEVLETHRGPIINYIFGALGSFKIDEEDNISLAWTGFNDQYVSFVNAISSFLIDNLDDLLNFAQNSTKTFFSINMLLTTSDNHLITQQCGIHPLRRNSDSGNYIKDGTTTEHDWIGLVPPQDRIHLVDPKKGYFVHANNRVASSQYYGGYLNHTIFTARADRIDELIRNEIKAGRKIGVEFAKRVFADTVDVYCRQILPQILAIVNESRDTFSQFNCNFTSQSYISTMYEVLMYQFYSLTKPFSPEKMSAISMHWTQQGIFNNIHDAYRGNQKKRQLLNKAWQNMISHLSNHFQTTNKEMWIWGIFHVDRANHIPFRNHPILKHIFNLQFPGSGNFHTPNVGKMQKLEFNNFETTHRANYRAVFSYSQKQESEWIIDSGVSENILSRHYSDQWNLFKQNELIPLTQSKAPKDGDL